ncbi:MAG TPA: hypothetical protein DCK95_02940 [Anaerolineaceae bacterium]|uniref:NadR/Ttd14 AAA domain-containing protein n=1 Tax=Anaerolinea thermophila TaxID=167964 RepID=A0A101FYV4_9CHLR|nr:MAG: Uncharacterized protein XD73_0230 [Anaerolinea thermophila]HAF61264.1 hypothetical protein [Anaerolineaceae bacterium]
MTNNIFQTLFFLARPAAGKSEIIHYLESVPLSERMERFHVGKMIPLDDFPMLWSWFEDDDLLAEMGKPRLHTDEEGYFKYPYLWDLLIKRLGLEYKKLQRDNDLEDATVIIEFSRGKEHGGYRSAFNHMDACLVNQAAIVYVDVSWEESLRKNRKRFNPDKPDSILEHGIPDKKLEHMYAETDWFEITQDSPDYLVIAGHKVPFIVFENEDDLTSKINRDFLNRLNERMNTLWHLYESVDF